MNTTEWTCPGADEHGFVTFPYLKQQAADSSEEAFLDRFPRPALQVVDDVPSIGSEASVQADSGVQLLTESIQGAAILRYLTRVTFIAKRPGNPFAHLISVGRSPKNDITIAVNSVSKVHGYFVPDGDRWSFTDHGSSNGSTLNGEVLASGQHYPLKDGDRLTLGLEVTLELLSPESLYRRVREAAQRSTRRGEPFRRG
ncbi:MAG: FHA domain-containing protein [Acidobacteriota bacterium]